MSKFKYEIPFQKDKDKKYRLFEILPGFLSWSILLIPFVLAYTNVGLAAILMTQGFCSQTMSGRGKGCPDCVASRVLGFMKCNLGINFAKSEVRKICPSWDIG